MKKTVRTIENEYDEDGNLTKSTETIVEEIIYTGIKPPSSPSVKGTMPYGNGIWNKPVDKPVDDNNIYTSKGSDPLSVTYSKGKI